MGISLCMIVKNEEDWIEGALESVRSIVDEIIIADTGCTDRTIEKARRFAPKVLDYKWIGDFSHARNFTLAEARQSWILVLDADERIAACDLPLIADAVHKSESGYHLVQRNYVEGNQVFGWTANTAHYEEGRRFAGYVDNPLIRLFRNDPGLRFQGAVHEIIDPTRLPAHYQFGTVPAVIHHYGKVCGAARVAAKQQHYLALGLKKVQEDPGNPKAHFDLGIQYQELQEHAHAVECFARTHEMSALPTALLYGAVSEKHRGRYAEALALLDKALASGFNTFDLRLERGNVLLALGRVRDALRDYERSQRMRPENPIAAFNCGLASRKLKDLSTAEGHYRRALKLDPAFKIASLELAILRADLGNPAESAQLLAPVVERHPDYREARLTLAKIYIKMNRTSEAIALLAPTGSDDATARSLMGAAWLQQGDIDAAQSHLESAIRLDRTLIDAKINLASVWERKGDGAKARRFLMSASESIRSQQSKVDA